MERVGAVRPQGNCKVTRSQAKSAANLEQIEYSLRTLMRPKKLRMLVVDDEPDNLDLLYRTFRRDFQVFKADSGIRALEVLEEEGEVAVIISDQRMPEMKGTEFLSKTLPQFPDTVRIILTGFTDVQDLVEAINSGQVYRYITKPWDSEELRSVVKKAADTYELLKQRTEELVWVRQQLALMCEIATIADESTDAAEGMAKMARAIADPFETSRTVFQPLEDGSATGGGICAPSDDPCDWLGGDPIVAKAIASKQMEGSADFSQDKEFSDVGHYKDADVRAHFVLPICLQGTAIAVLSLQWQKPCPLKPDTLKWVRASGTQIAIALSNLMAKG